MMLGKGKMYWYAAATAPEAQPDAAIGRKKELEMIYQDWFPAIPELIAATEESQILTTDLYDRPPTQPWSQQNITLLGDAAHPMLPTMGQGACTALDDAYVVAECLQEQPDSNLAFQQYEALRFPRTKAIVEASLRSLIQIFSQADRLKPLFNLNQERRFNSASTAEITVSNT